MWFSNLTLFIYPQSKPRRFRNRAETSIR